MKRGYNGLRRRIIPANQLTKADREFWKALQDSKKESFTMADFAIIAKTLGKSTRSAKRYVANLRANGKLGIEFIYNLYY